MQIINRKKFSYYLFSQIVLLIFFNSNNSVLCQQKINEDWFFLSTTTIGAKQFIQAHPKYDGRGIVIFICDSGVDMDVAGLKKTSTDRTKVIDVCDFSGQGDVSLYVGKKGAEDNEKYIEHPDGFRLFNYHLLDKKPVDDEYLIGYLDEKRFKNSQVNDINNNGSNDDLFGILVFEVETEDTLYWVAYVDTDGDQHLEDEKPIRDYHINYDFFQLRGGDKKFDRRFMTFALNILPYEMKASIHFDDDGHGTHVAGIAAGYEINNQKGLNGIAPGAQIISLKIGNGTYEGGCTISGSLKNALNFAENYAQKHKTPVVINISFGIGSIREGQSEIDRLVNDLLTYNDNIFLAISNGNEGPGISTTGTPAAAGFAFSVGALLPSEIANKCYGTNLDGDKIYYFSACGGELNKPDVLAPGSASSTVPGFADDDIMRGTSMAAPQAAGAAAILLSTAKQFVPQIPTSTLLIKRALKYSAILIPNYSYLEQGNGVINIPGAFKLLKSYGENYNAAENFSYDITTECPSSFNERSPSAYWRSSGYFPTDDEKQTFFVNPIFSDSVNADQRANFYRAFNLKSTHSWLSPVKKSVYIKGEIPAETPVKYNKKLLTKPGLYCGKIIASRKDGASSFNRSKIEFELLNTVIIPHTFNHENKYQQKFQNRVIKSGDVDKYFILVPIGATAAKIAISPAKNKFCNVSCFCFTPQGHQYFRTRWVKSKKQNQVAEIISSKFLSSGIWEIDVYSNLQNEKKSTYNLSINFSSFKIDPPDIADFDYQLGRDPEGSFTVTNQFNVPFYGFGRGKIVGYQRIRMKTVLGQDTFSYNFTPGAEVKKAEFLIDFEDESFLKLTDVALNIYDSKGRAVVKESLTLDKGSIVLDQINDEFYTLEIVAASVYDAANRKWRFQITEKYYVKDQINLKIYSENARLFKLFPSITRKLEFTLDNSPKIAPDGFDIFGDIEFIDRNLLQQQFTVPIVFKK